MIVKFVAEKINDGRTHSDLEDNQLYVVLSIWYGSNNDVSVSILDNCGTPTLVPLNFFEIIDERILGEWEFTKGENHYYLSLLNLHGKVYSFTEDLLDGEYEVRKEAEERLSKEITQQKKLHNIEF